MTETCACHPGTQENGWHEVRCIECLMVERAQWHKAMSAHLAATEYALSYLDYRMNTAAS